MIDMSELYNAVLLISSLTTYDIYAVTLLYIRFIFMNFVSSVLCIYVCTNQLFRLPISYKQLINFVQTTLHLYINNPELAKQ